MGIKTFARRKIKTSAFGGNAKIKVFSDGLNGNISIIMQTAKLNAFLQWSKDEVKWFSVISLKGNISTMPGKVLDYMSFYSGPN